MMKRINLEELNRRNDYKIDDFMRGVLSMEFIKVGDKYLLKDSNGKVVSEEEKLKLERNELVLKDEDCGCQVEQIKKKSKINRKINEIEKATKEVANDTIEETNSTL